MLPSTPITHRLIDAAWTGYMRSRRGCDIVISDNQSTAYCAVATGSEPLLILSKKSACRQALQTKPTQFDLKNIVEDDWKQEKTIASQSHNT